jgi:hypothetical protein
MSGAIIDYLPKLFFLIILIIVARCVLKMTRMLFRAAERERLTLSGSEVKWA